VNVGVSTKRKFNYTPMAYTCQADDRLKRGMVNAPIFRASVGCV